MLPSETQPSQGFAFRNPFTDLPRLSKAIALLLFVLYFLALVFPSVLNLFALKIGYTLSPPFYVFNVFTSSFVDTNFFNVLINAAAVLLLGKYLEPIWGSKEFLRFILINSLVTGIATFWTMVFWFMLTRQEAILYTYFWCGFSGVVTALTVAIKQLNPEYETKLFLVIPLRAKHVPSILVLMSTVGVLFGFSVASYPFVVFGTYFGWVYLRFFQRKGESVGDLHEMFGFDSFFPELVAPYIAKVGRICYNVVGLCGIWKKFGPESGNNNANGNNANDSADAKRRRARAALSLEKRLAQQESGFVRKDDEGESSTSETPQGEEAV